MVRLAEREGQLALYESVHFRGHWDADGTRMIAAIRSVVGGEAMTVRRLPWWALRLLAPVVSLVREMVEVRYLWQAPFELDNARLLRLLGDEPHTPFEAAMAQALAGIGCTKENGKKIILDAAAALG